MIRPARIRDAQFIARIINHHASQGLMLPISLTQIYEQLRDFVVAEEEGKVIGCGAMHVVWDSLGEIRSVAIDEDHRKKGIGSGLTKKLLDMAREMEAKTVFILTYQTGFFGKFGFCETDKETLPHKIWQVCLNCHKFPNCDEVAMTLQLD